MTKKDYELIASVIREVHDDYPHDGAVDAIASRLSDRLKAQNPRHNRAVFLAACGVA